jgi:hypothetical protein
MCWKLAKIGIERGNQLPPYPNYSTQTPVSRNHFWRRKDGARGRLPALGNDKYLTYTLQNSGQWNMKDKKYYQPGYISEWVVINFTNERGIEQIMRGLVECCNARGTFPSPRSSGRP